MCFSCVQTVFPFPVSFFLHPPPPPHGELVCHGCGMGCQEGLPVHARCVHNVCLELLHEPVPLI